MRHYLTLEAIVLVTIGGLVGLVFALQANKSPQQLFVDAVNPSVSVNHVQKTTPAPEQEELVSEVSSDGKKTIFMDMDQNSDGSTTYILSVADGDEKKQVLFREALGTGESMAIPFNTWSPDNKYFFITMQTKQGPQVLIFNASGEAFSENDFYLDATALFAKRDTGFVFDEATGWASESLLLINSKTKDNIKGPSFWLEVPSTAVIRLSTEF